MIYFVKCTLSGLVKIGHSVAPYGRILTLQESTPNQLVPLRIADGTKDTEFLIHSELVDLHVTREWFKDCRRLRKVMNRYKNVMDLPPALRRPTRLRGITPRGHYLTKKELAAGVSYDPSAK